MRSGYAGVSSFSAVASSRFSAARNRRHSSSGGGKLGDGALDARRVVNLDDTLAVGCVGEGEAEHLGVLPGLLQPLGGVFVACLGFDHSDGEVGSVAQQVIGAFLPAAPGRAAGKEDAPVGQGALLVDGVRRGIPAGGLELGNDEPAAGIGFVQWHATSSDRAFSISLLRCRFSHIPTKTAPSKAPKRHSGLDPESTDPDKSGFRPPENLDSGLRRSDGSILTGSYVHGDS